MELLFRYQSAPLPACPAQSLARPRCENPTAVSRSAPTLTSPRDSKAGMAFVNVQLSNFFRELSSPVLTAPISRLSWLDPFACRRLNRRRSSAEVRRRRAMWLHTRSPPGPCGMQPVVDARSSEQLALDNRNLHAGRSQSPCKE